MRHSQYATPAPDADMKAHASIRLEPSYATASSITTITFPPVAAHFFRVPLCLPTFIVKFPCRVLPHKRVMLLGAQQTARSVREN